MYSALLGSEQINRFIVGTFQDKTMFGSKPEAPSMSLDATHYKGPLQVTMAFLALYFCFLFFQGLSKFYLFFKEKAKGGNNKSANLTKIKYFGGSTDRLALTGDRTTGNMVEQSVPFLTSLWLCAMFHSPEYAARVGWYWLGSRVIYPVVFHYGMPYLLLSTVPGYVFIGMLAYPVVVKALE